jgi:dephospho-CoA kinase
MVRSNRAKLGAVVFADKVKRDKLNSILHPFIIARQDEIIQQWANEAPNAVGVIDAALMIESGGYKRFDKLIVVHCQPEIQIHRLMKRNSPFTRGSRASHQVANAAGRQNETCELLN